MTWLTSTVAAGALQFTNSISRDSSGGIIKRVGVDEDKAHSSTSSIPILDLFLSYESDESITTAVYRKSTHPDKYLDFESHHPPSHKKSVVNTPHSNSSSAPTATVKVNYIVCAVHKSSCISNS